MTEIQPCTRADFDQVLNSLSAFWGSERTRSVHHPMCFYEFGSSAWVIRDGETVVAYLFGFKAQTGPYAYIHLVGVREGYQRQGLARRLYEHFERWALAQGCTALKAVTSPPNERSIAFHRRLGFVLEGEPNEQGIPVVKDYYGPGLDWVVMRKEIG